jgi:hypothetical protein
MTSTAFPAYVREALVTSLRRRQPAARPARVVLNFLSAWLAGLALVGWLGSYPDPAAGAGNLGVLGFGWAILVLAAFSAVIMWLAAQQRLTTDKVEAHLQEPVTPLPPEPVVGR